MMRNLSICRLFNDTSDSLMGFCIVEFCCLQKIECVKDLILHSLDLHRIDIKI